MNITPINTTLNGPKAKTKIWYTIKRIQQTNVHSERKIKNQLLQAHESKSNKGDHEKITQREGQKEKEMRSKIFQFIKANKISQTRLKNENNSYLCRKGLRDCVSSEKLFNIVVEIMKFYYLMLVRNIERIVDFACYIAIS